MFAQEMSQHIAGFEEHDLALRAKHYLFWLISQPFLAGR
jgi:hypothetical protein